MSPRSASGMYVWNCSSAYVFISSDKSHLKCELALVALHPLGGGQCGILTSALQSSAYELSSIGVLLVLGNEEFLSEIETSII